MPSVVDLHGWCGWLPLLILPLAVVIFTPARWPRWAFMWLLAIAIFSACKWLTWWFRPRQSAPLWRHIGYLIAWPGLDAIAFFDPRLRPTVPHVGEWLFAVGKFALGIALYF